MLRLDFAAGLGLCVRREAAAMISDEVRQAGLAAVSVAAAMLVENAHERLVAVPVTAEQEVALAAILNRLATDLMAFADAAAVFARRD